jgi:hypothetical protein
MTDEPTDGGQTPPNDDGKTGGTPEEVAARNAEAEANRNKLIATLESTVHAERTEKARLAAENETLKRSQSPAANGKEADPIAGKISRVKAFADGTAVPGLEADVTSELLLEALKRIDQQDDALAMTQREIGNLHRINQIKEDDLRSEVEKEFNSNRNLYGTPDVARAVVEGRRQAEKAKTMEEENAKLRAALAATASRTGSDVVRTHAPSEVTAVELKARMTQAEWNERQRQLTEARDAGNETAGRTLMSEQIKRRKGEINVAP